MKDEKRLQKAKFYDYLTMQTRAKLPSLRL